MLILSKIEIIKEWKKNMVFKKNSDFLIPKNKSYLKKNMLIFSDKATF